MEECYLCGNRDSRTVHPRVRDREDVAVLQCTACELVYLNRRDHISENFYGESGMYGGVKPDIDSLLRNEERDTLRRTKKLTPITQEKSYLDFGCGAGAVLAGLSETAKLAEGVELNPHMRDFLKTTHKLQVHSSLKHVEKRYEVITAFHVLEHLPDPRQILKDLSGCLEPHGSLYIEVPNANDALLKLYDCKAFKDFTYWSCHLFLFSPDTLTRLVEQAGLVMEELEQIQRYPLSNHLFWLRHGKPGGHEKWPQLTGVELDKAYAFTLSQLGLGDTLLARIRTPAVL